MVRRYLDFTTSVYSNNDNTSLIENMNDAKINFHVLLCPFEWILLPTIVYIWAFNKRPEKLSRLILATTSSCFADFLTTLKTKHVIAWQRFLFCSVSLDTKDIKLLTRYLCQQFNILYQACNESFIIFYEILHGSVDFVNRYNIYPEMLPAKNLYPHSWRYSLSGSSNLIIICKIYLPR